MSKVLLILPNTVPHPARRLLQLLGIPHDVAYSGSSLQTPGGDFAWTNDNAIRNYLRQYQAVLVGLEFQHLGWSQARQQAYRWMGWNDPEDPPVAYIGVYPRAGGNFTLPSDFPILQPNPANPSGTTASYPAGAFEQTANLRVRLHRENTELYIQAANLYQDDSGTGRIYLLDTAKHAALGAQGEILATPVSEDATFPTNAVLAYRYKNRYLLPISYIAGTNLYTSGFLGMFWTVYALKLLGVQPAYSIPMFLAMDDALTLHNPPVGSESIQPTFAQWTHIAKETYRHIAEVLYPRSGMAMVCGLFTGGRYGRRSTAVPHENTHWDLVMEGRRWTGSGWETLDNQTRANLQEWHNLLLRHHRGALPCTPHDHTLYHYAQGVKSSFRRHSDAGYAYAAPNDVPLTRGSTLVKASSYTGTPPTGYRERVIDGELYYEWGFSATSGTGDTMASVAANNYHGARLIWETAVAEMHALGFPDAIGNGNYPLLISPGGHTGDVSVWKAHYDLGYRLTRTNLRTTHTPPDTNPASWWLPREGMWFAFNQGVDASLQYDAHFGLYHPSYASRTAVGAWNIDLSNDIIGIWNSDRPTASRRAYRRAIGYASGVLLRTGLLFSTMMAHPYNVMTWADPNDPTRPFDPNDPDSRINFLLELAWNLEKMVNVLYPYLKWGTVKEYIAIRERIIA